MLANLIQTYEAKPWFKQPNYMPNWLYRYFGETIKPLITAKDGQQLLQPLSFTENKPHAPTTMWIHPPDAVFHLSCGNQLDPTILYWPCAYFSGSRISLLPNFVALAVKQEFWRKMVHCALTALLTLTTTFTLCHGHITAVMGASHTSLGGIWSSLDPFHHIFV